MTDDCLRDRLQIGALLAAPAFVAALSIPLLSYRHNDTEFLSGLRALQPFVAVAALAVTVALILAFTVPIARRLAIAAGCIAVWIVFQDALVPIRWTQLDGTERLSWTWSQAGAQLLIALVIAGIVRITPGRTRRILLLVVLTPTVATSLFTLASIALARRVADAPSTHGSAQASGRPNVYQIVLDGFGGDAFPAVMQRTDTLRRFDGFVRFADARASFVATDLSVPNFLTGTVPGARPVSAWARAARTSGIREALVHAGYRLSLYVPDRARGWSSPMASMATTSQDVSDVDQAALDRLTLAKITLVRIMPAPLRIRALDLISRYRIRDYLYYRQFNTELIDAFVRDEAARPATGQYVYVHLMLPHPPYVRDARCARVAASTYDRQADCAIRQVDAILAMLERLRRLRGSLVIVQSDHGMNTGDPPVAARLPRPTGALAATIAAHNRDSGGLDGFLERTNALLLIHAPSSVPHAPLRVSPAPALLSDLPATIAAATGVVTKRWPGIALSALDADAPRTLPFFAITRFPGDEPLPPGTAFTFDPARGWRVASARR